MSRLERLMATQDRIIAGYAIQTVLARADYQQCPGIAETHFFCTAPAFVDVYEHGDPDGQPRLRLCAVCAAQRLAP